MNVLILGAGQVGYGLARSLASDDHDICVVDNSIEAINNIRTKLEVLTVVGNCSDPFVLKEAGAEEADIVVAVTSSDEANMMACQISHFCFNVPAKILTVSNTNYLKYEGFFGADKFNVDLVVSEENEANKMLERGISIQGAFESISYAKDRLKIIGVAINRNAPIIETPLRLLQSITKVTTIVLFIDRGGKYIIPSKDDVLEDGDIAYFLVETKGINELIESFGYEKEDKAKLIVITGSDISYELVRFISGLDERIETTVIEKNREKAEHLSESLENIEVMCGDVLDNDVLSSAGVNVAHTTVAVTDDDKTNILSCLLAKKSGSNRVAALLNDLKYSKIIQSLGVSTIIDPRQAVIAKILQYINKGNFDVLMLLGEETVGILSVDVLGNSYAIGLTCEDIFESGEILISALIRDKEIHMFPKKMIISANDQILISAKKEHFAKLEKLFLEKPKYLR